MENKQETQMLPVSLRITKDKEVVAVLPTIPANFKGDMTIFSFDEGHSAVCREYYFKDTTSVAKIFVDASHEMHAKVVSFWNKFKTYYEEDGTTLKRVNRISSKLDNLRLERVRRTL